jgi:hypothetical protein
VVWNRAGQRIQLEVRLGDQVVLADQLRDANVATSIEVGRILQRAPGTYILRVTDRTRDQEDSVAVQIAPRGQNIGVHLTPSGLAVVLTREDVTNFTPPPSARGSK